MSLFGRGELGDTRDPVELVPGDVMTLDETTTGLRKLSNACQEASSGLSTLDVGHWTGEAAERFQRYFSQEMPKWRDAAEAFGPVVEALTTYRGAVERAQRAAVEAIRLHDEAEAETKAAEDERDAAESQHRKASAAAEAGGPVPVPLAPFVDPGKAKREAARRMLADARRTLKAAAAETAAIVTKAKDRAPEEPGFLSKFAASIEDSFEQTVTQVSSFHSGMAESGLNLLEMVRAGNPLDPYNVAHPGEYAEHLVKQASGMVHLATHPAEAVRGLLNFEEWKKDPFSALGRLTGDAAIAVATDGAGLVGAAEKAVLREATEQAATQVAKHVDDGLPPWHRPGYEPPAHTQDYHPHHGDEPFGPQKTDEPAPHDREPDPPAEEPRHEPDEQPRVREPEHLPEPDKSQYFQLQRSVAEMQDSLPQLSLAERTATEQRMAQQRQMMRDILDKHA
ncbi:putative T7SS-secreted protein [Lentzea sp. NPDC059081]|uniref:putative T7SS-secreted protein n=1 Tax=Lentzea sp. NPDC059081 TaxID=3346719 RepID=UPI0036A34DDF